MKKVYIIAAILALAAGALIYFYLDGLDNQEVSEVQYEVVVTAAEDIPAYSVITDDMVMLTTLPLGSGHVLAARATADVIGLTTENAILAGEQIITPKLKMPGESSSGLAYVIPEGMRAMTVAVDNVSGVSSLIRQGDYVDVVAHITTTFATTDELEPVPAETTLIAADNVLVAALDGEMIEVAPVDGVRPTYAYVTLIVTTEEAMRITEGYRYGLLTLLLRASGDHDANGETPIYADNLIVPQTER